MNAARAQDLDPAESLQLSVDGQKDTEGSANAPSVKTSRSANLSATIPQTRELWAKDIGGLLDAFLSCCRTGLVQVPLSAVPSLEPQGGASIRHEERASLGSSTGVWSDLQELDRLEVRFNALSINSNLAYWRLGSSLQAFVEVRIHS